MKIFVLEIKLWYFSAIPILILLLKKQIYTRNNCSRIEKKGETKNFTFLFSEISLLFWPLADNFQLHYSKCPACLIYKLDISEKMAFRNCHLLNWISLTFSLLIIKFLPILVAFLVILFCYLIDIIVIRMADFDSNIKYEISL